jgi:MFS family permease
MPAAARLPRTVIVLGIVSLLMDVSSEMIHALLPLFLTAGLGASVALVGLFDGLAEATSSIVKIFSGRISDFIGRRKALLLFGYGLAAATKPFFAAATAPAAVLAAHLADRFGKGVRGSPRDALIADVTPANMRGRAFGLRQAFDTAGAVAGPVAALLLMAASGDIRLVFWAATVPALFCVAMIVLGVSETGSGERSAGPLFDVSLLRALGRGFWGVAALGVAFSLARFSEAFLVLRAHEAGLALALAPAVFVLMNLVYALAAYPVGARADRAGPRSLLAGGLVALLAADAALALAPGLPAIFLGVALWGAHLALTQGVFAKMIADAAPADLRATAYGAFHFLTGLALLAGNILAGLLWDRAGSAATFAAGAAFAIAAAAGLLLASGRRAAGP